MDYRSVVVYACGERYDGPDKERILAAFVAKIIPGHKIRPARPQELNATLVLRFPLEEVSAKVRDCGNIDVEDDYALDLWAGVIPLRLTAQPPVPDPRLKPGIPTPDFSRVLRR